MSTLSILTSLYKSDDYIINFINQAKKVLDHNQISDFEFIIVNDGSPDNSITKIKNNFENKNLNIKIINLSRNFGHHKALIAGMKYCTKDFIFLIDCDLEVNPNCLTNFYRLMNSDSTIDCVSGISNEKNKFYKQNIFTISFSKVFSFIFNFLSDFNSNKNQVHVRLMKKKYLEGILSCDHTNPFLLDLYEYVGFNKKFLEVDYKKREKSSYTFKKKFEFFYNFFLSNSKKILNLYFWFSLSFVLLAFIMCLNFFIKYFILDVAPGYTSTILMIIFFGSLTLLGTSFCALYLLAIYQDLKKLPNSIVSNIIDI
jgi:putative glycosyltransferase